MCDIQINTYKKKFLNQPMLYTAMIALGLYSGLSGLPTLQHLGQLVSDIFIRMFKCISLPIISLSLITMLTQYRVEGAFHSIWRRTMIYTLGTTGMAAGVSCLLYGLLKPDNLIIANANESMHTVEQADYFQYLTQIFPETLFTPFLTNQVMSVLLLSVVIGIGVRLIPDEDAKNTLIQFFRGAQSLFMIITRWIVAVIPLGLYGFITTTVTQLNQGFSFHGIGAYFLIILLANLVQGLVVLPLWLKFEGIAPFKMMKRMFPALSLAFFSKSSVGTLPVTMSTIEKKAGVRASISRVVLPLCTSVNMNGCAAFIFVTVIYLMQNQGMTISYTLMLSWVAISTIVAIGNAGVPMGCFFLSISLLSSMNIPVTLMSIILPFYNLIDMVETTLNVWSDSCVAKVIDEKSKIEETITLGAQNSPR